MADVKWIKITTDIFDDEKILLIESLPDSYAIITVWFKLLCLAGKQNNNGVFLMGRIAYTDKMLATIFRMKESTVTMALNTFQQFGMVEIVDGVITIPNWNKHQTLDAYEKKKERDRLYQAERRAQQRALVAGSSLPENGLPLKEWQMILKEFNHQCAYCGRTEGLEQEHIIPVIRGGKYEIGNIIPACRHCNASKKDKDVIEWYTKSDVFDEERLQHIIEYKKSSDTSGDSSDDSSSFVVVSEEDIEEDKEIEIEIDNKKTRIDCQQIVDLYHSICKSFPSVRSLSDARKKAIKARLKTYTIDDFRTVFENAEASSFLKGVDGGWKASFDWLIKEANMLKVLEGNYADKPRRYGRKEPVPGWVQKTPDDYYNDPDFMRAIQRTMAEPDDEQSTVGNDPELAERAEKLKQRLSG